MTSPPAVEIAALDRDQCGVRAVFNWRGGCYGHAIVGVVNGEETPLLEGIDAPPLQEAVKHQPGDGPPSLLFAGAGEGRYWSATVTPITDLHFALLGFDFACRRGREAQLPAVAYRLANGVIAEPQQRDGALLFRTADRHEFLLRAAEMPTSLATESAPTCKLVLTPQGVAIEALGSPHVTTRQTIQWRYEISAIRRP
jgi:hypothetical protein